MTHFPKKNGGTQFRNQVISKFSEEVENLLKRSCVWLTGKSFMN